MCKCCLKLFGAQLPCLGAHLLYTRLRLSYEGMANTFFPGGKVGMEEILSICAKSPGGFQLMWIQFDDLLPKYFVLH